MGFERVEMRRRGGVNVSMELDVCRDLSVVDEEGRRKVVIGQHSIVVGAKSERQVKHYVDVRLGTSEGRGVLCM